MRLGKCSIINFGSYKELEFDFSGHGLTLISGPTGAGKSTIADIPAWILFGQTAKGGSVEDVKAWSGDGPTAGTLEVDNTLVTRVRGSTSQNDLYWLVQGSDEKIRGKDLADTQRLLEAKLGVTADGYFTSAYYHEFSPTTTFFTGKSKERRALFEDLVDLSFPVILAEKLTVTKKAAKDDVSKHKSAVDKLTAQIAHTRRSLESAQDSAQGWENKTQQTIKTLLRDAAEFDSKNLARKRQLEAKSLEFEAERKNRAKAIQTEMKALSRAIEDADALNLSLGMMQKRDQERANEACPSCGKPKGLNNETTFELRQRIAANNSNIAQLQRLKSEYARQVESTNLFIDQIKELSDSKNVYSEMAEKERGKSNPFVKIISQFESEAVQLVEAQQTHQAELDNSQTLLDCTQYLYEMTFELRKQLLLRTVKQAEQESNRLLQTYFDGEFALQFTLVGSDDLEITILREGVSRKYGRLSKGQRALLRFCFTRAVMKASANKFGVHMDTIFFDEGLDGLDTERKLKAFQALSELQKDHGSVFVIDHSPDLQTMFDHKLTVTLEGGHSEVAVE